MKWEENPDPTLNQVEGQYCPDESIFNFLVSGFKGNHNKIVL